VTLGVDDTDLGREFTRNLASTRFATASRNPESFASAPYQLALVFYAQIFSFCYCFAVPTPYYGRYFTAFALAQNLFLSLPCRFYLGIL
jgi:hypothetical protein